MSEGFSFRSRSSDYHGDYGLGNMLCYKVRCIFLHGSTYLSEEDNHLCLRVLLKKGYGISLGHPPERTSSEGHYRGLAYSGFRKAFSYLVGQGSALGYDTYVTFHVHHGRMGAEFALAWSYQTCCSGTEYPGTVGICVVQ